MSTEELIYNVLAVIGSILLLFGFYRVNIGKWNNKSFWYELDNVVGVVFIIIYQMHYHAYVSVVVNVIWGGVAVIGIMSFFRRLHHHRKKRRA